MQGIWLKKIACEFLVEEPGHTQKFFEKPQAKKTTNPNFPVLTDLD